MRALVFTLFILFGLTAFAHAAALQQAATGTRAEIARTLSSSLSADMKATPLQETSGRIRLAVKKSNSAGKESEKARRNPPRAARSPRGIEKQKKKRARPSKKVKFPKEGRKPKLRSSIGPKKPLPNTVSTPVKKPTAAKSSTIVRTKRPLGTDVSGARKKRGIGQDTPVTKAASPSRKKRSLSDGISASAKKPKKVPVAASSASKSMDGASRMKRLHNRRLSAFKKYVHKPMPQVIDGLKNKSLKDGLREIGLNWRKGPSGPREKPGALSVGGTGGSGPKPDLTFAPPLDFIRFGVKPSRLQRAAKDSPLASIPGVTDIGRFKQPHISNAADVPDADKVGESYDAIKLVLAKGKGNVVSAGLEKLMDAEITKVERKAIHLKSDPAITQLTDWAKAKPGETRPTRRQQAISMFLGVTQIAEPDITRNVGADKLARATVKRIAKPTVSGGAAETFHTGFNNKDGAFSASWAKKAKAPFGGVKGLRDGMKQELEPKFPKRQKKLNDIAGGMSDSSESESSSGQ